MHHMRITVLAAMLISSSAIAGEDELATLIYCVAAEREVEEIICPVAVENEQIKACECPEGMAQVLVPGTGKTPPKASGS